MKFMNVIESKHLAPAQWNRRGVSSATQLNFYYALRSRCALYTLVAIKALPLRLYNSWIAQPRRFHCSLGALSAFLYFYATLMATELRSAYYLLALKTFHNSIRTFSLKCYPVKSRQASCIHRLGQEAIFIQSGPQERYANFRFKVFYSLCFTPAPL